MKAYRVAGTFSMGGRKQPFRKEVAAADESEAVEWVYSVLGSNHRTLRRDIAVVEVVEIPLEELEGGRLGRGAGEEE